MLRGMLTGILRRINHIQISSSNSQGVLMMKSAPSFSRSSLSRKPQVTPTLLRFEFLAVWMSTSESPT